MARNKLRPLYPPKHQRRRHVDAQGNATPQVELSTQQVQVPNEFLAEHGRVSMELANCRSALAQANQTIQVLIERLKEAIGGQHLEQGQETVSGVPILRRKPELAVVEDAAEPVGATPDAS
jgi:hypothetical protein